MLSRINCNDKLVKPNLATLFFVAYLSLLSDSAQATNDPSSGFNGLLDPLKNIVVAYMDVDDIHRLVQVNKKHRQSAIDYFQQKVITVNINDIQAIIAKAGPADEAQAEARFKDLFSEHGRYAKISQLKLSGRLASNNRFPISWFKHLPESLQHLAITHVGLSAEDINMLTNYKNLTKLTTLDLSDNRIGPAGAQALAKSTQLMTLMALDLSFNYIEPGSVQG